MGLGYGRFRAGAIDVEALRFGDGAQWSHSSADAKGRRQRQFPHREVDGVSTASAGHSSCAVAVGSSGGKAALGPRHQDRHVHARQGTARRHRSTFGGRLRQRRATGTLSLHRLRSHEDPYAKWRGGYATGAWVLTIRTGKISGADDIAALQTHTVSTVMVRVGTKRRLDNCPLNLRGRSA